MSGLLYEPPAKYGRPRGVRPAGNALPDAPPALQTAYGLEPNVEPLTRMQAIHLLRRAAFGATSEQVTELVGMPADQAASRIVREALAAPVPEPPAWAGYFPPWGGTEAEIQRYADRQGLWFARYVASWVAEMVRGGLREKLVLFWHDHFATERNTYFWAIMAYQYVDLLRANALGNFREFVARMGVCPAMLVYLDGQLSTRQEPNENYARELLELFTMGQLDAGGASNYTQQDIVELSRALAGWRVDYHRFESVYSYSRGDAGEKELFGQRGRYDYNAVHDLIFEARSRQIADFMARKLYREFVYETPTDEIAASLADIFLDSGFEIAPVVQAILGSRHFYAEEVIGSKIKSPAALVVGLMKDLGHRDVEQAGLYRVADSLRILGQRLLNPPNVAGWPGYRTWISTSSLPQRWQELDFLVRGGIANRPLNLVPLARQLLDAQDPLVVFNAPVALAEHFIAAPLSELSLDAPEQFAGDLDSFPIPEEIANGPAHVQDLAKIFLGSAPWYSWDLYRQGIAFAMTRYLLYLTQLPEYQLT